LAAAKAFQSALTRRPADQGKKNKFRFVYCSGILAERDQDRSLWFMGDARRMRVCTEFLFLYLVLSSCGSFCCKVAGRGVLSFSPFFENEKRWLTNAFHYTVLQGEVENKLIAFANEHPDTFQSFIVRPGGVLA
jgi:hypothetical protein